MSDIQNVISNSLDYLLDFSPEYSNSCLCCTWAKSFVWLDRVLHQRAVPTNPMIAGANSYARSPWGVRVKQLTMICWNLIAPPSTPNFFEHW